ncbi:MAG: ABC transporter substrate-binding protein [Atopobiaceae bacterium]|nr:ABC transporter substrate-binding protein [Atopobiaceae bacterium]
MANFVSRRQFLQGSALAASGVAAMSLVGCGGSGDDGGDKKKVFRFGQANAKEGLDMQKSTNSKSSSVIDHVVETPLRFTEDNELVPCMLKEVPTVESDGVTYKCELNEGMKWHDGTEVKASDIKYTFERMFDPATGAKSTYMYDMIKGAKEKLAGTASEIEGIVVEDDTHITFTLTEPFACFTKNIGINYASIYPEAGLKKAGDKWGTGTDIYGCGPYKLVSNDDSTEVTFEPFEDYYGEKAKLDKIVIKYIDDENTKMMSFKNGEIDMCDLNATLLKQYKGDADVKDLINQYGPLGVTFVNLNLKNKYLADKRVRQALSLAINRQELVDTVMNGAGTVASGWLNPKTPGFDDSAEAFPYDVDKAKALLKEAGVDGISLTCGVRAADQPVMVAVQDYWKKIGVDLKVNVQDAAKWSADWAAGSLEITELSWHPLYADADNHMYTYFYSENAKGKSSFYNNPEFDKLMDEARKSTDEDKRVELYKKADDILTRQDYATLPLFYPKFQFVAKDYVKNAKVGNLIYHMRDIDVDTSADDYTGEE